MRWHFEKTIFLKTRLVRACGFQERGQNRKTSLPQHVQCGERRCATRMGACHDHGGRTALAVRRRFGIRGLRLSDMTHRSARAVLRTPRHSRAGQLRRSRNESGRCLRRGARGVGYGGAPGAVWPVLRNAPRASVAEQIGVAFSLARRGTPLRSTIVGAVSETTKVHWPKLPLQLPAPRRPPKRSLLRLLFGVKRTRCAQSELFRG